MLKLKRTAAAIPSLLVLEEPLFFNSFLTSQMLQPASLRTCLREARWRSVIDPLLTIGPSVYSGLMEERQFPYLITQAVGDWLEGGQILSFSTSGLDTFQAAGK